MQRIAANGKKYTSDYVQTWSYQNKYQKHCYQQKLRSYRSKLLFQCLFKYLDNCFFKVACAIFSLQTAIEKEYMLFKTLNQI